MRTRSPYPGAHGNGAVPSRGSSLHPVVAAIAVAFVGAVAAPISLSHAAATDSHHDSGYSYRHAADGTDGFSYAVIDPGAHSNLISSGDRQLDSIERLARAASRPLFWFSLEDREYVVRDPEWIAKAKRIVAPMQELGERQGEVGAQQSALGERQSELGHEQGRIGARMGELGGRLAALSVRDADVGDDRDAEHQRSEIRQEMESLRARMEELRQKQQPLAAQQRELGKRQQAMGHEQQRVAATASEALEKLAREAVRVGKAERVQD